MPPTSEPTGSVATTAADPADVGLRADGLVKRFGDVVALDDVTLQVRPGEIVGFLGPNGAGKTTTMRAIMDLLSLDRGTVSWHGRPTDTAVRQSFGYMPAERGMYPRMRVSDHLRFYAELSGIGRVDAAREARYWIDRLGLSDRCNDPVQNLSSGNQQRVQLALALLGEPVALILDEPFSGLDPLAVEMLSEVLREQVDRGVALLLSSHQLDLVADVCSGVVIVDRGRVVLRGSVDELRESSPVRVLDVRFDAPTDWAPVGGILSAGDHRVVVEVPSSTPVAQLLDEAARHGTVVGFSLAPPDLSEVFHRSVRRDGDEVPT